MSVSDEQRLEMQLGLRKSLGDDVAKTLMDHLPPDGWSDVARSGDIDSMKTRMNSLEFRMDSLESRMDSLDTRMDSLESRMDSLDTRMNSLDSRMASLESHIGILDGRLKLMIAGMLSVGIALMTAQVQIVLRLAQL